MCTVTPSAYWNTVTFSFPNYAGTTAVESHIFKKIALYFYTSLLENINFCLESRSKWLQNKACNKWWFVAYWDRKRLIGIRM